MPEVVAAFLGKVIERAIISGGELRVEINGQVLPEQLLGEDRRTAESKLIALVVSFTVARRGSEVRLLLANGSAQPREPISALVRAVTPARTWSGWILAG